MQKNAHKKITKKKNSKMQKNAKKKIKKKKKKTFKSKQIKIQIVAPKGLYI
jgi:hypothetical protein